MRATGLAHLLAAITALAAACGSSEIREPGDFSPAPPVDADPAYGVPLAVGSPLRYTTASLTAKWGPVYAYVYEGAGWDADVRPVEAEATLYRIDPATGEGTVTARPPVEPAPRHFFGQTLADAVFLVLGRPEGTGLDLAYDGGSGWTVVAGPDGLAFDRVRYAVARSANELLLVSVDQDAWYHDASGWRRLTLPAPSVTTIAPGPWEAGGLALVYVVFDQRVCTVRFGAGDLAAGATSATPRCVDVPALGIAGTALNGGLDDFWIPVLAPQPAGEARLLHVTAAGIAIGRAFQASQLASAPGRTDLVALFRDPRADGDAFIPRALAVEDGRVAAELLVGGYVRTTCACDRATDPTCGCVARTPSLVLTSLDVDGARAALLFVDDVDARRTISIRMIALPVAETLFPGWECDVECPQDYVCAVGYDGGSECLSPGAQIDAVRTSVAVQAADPVLDAAPAFTLTSPDPSCTVTLTGGVGSEVHLDPFCRYTLDATAAGHAALHVEDLVTPSEDVPFTIGPYTLARGALLDDTPLASVPFEDDTRLAVSPGGGRMILTISGAWRWIAHAATSPGFTATELAPSPPSTFGGFPVSRPRFVADGRALVAGATQELLLVEDGAVVDTAAGTFDLSRAQVARAAPIAVVPAGAPVSGTVDLATDTAVVRFDGGDVRVIATSALDARAHTIRPDGREVAFIDSFGRVVRLDIATGTVSIPQTMWSNDEGLRVALGGADDFLVVAPHPSNTNVTNPCFNLNLCSIWAREDVETGTGDPGDPVIIERLTVRLSTRALWGEIGQSVGHVAWLERDAQQVAHLYWRDTVAGTTTEIPLGATLAQDLAHVAVGDTLIVMVPAGLLVVDLATGAHHLEAGTYAAANPLDREPMVRVGDDGLVYLREGCVAGNDPCGLAVFDPGTGGFSRLARDQVARWGVAGDRRYDGMVSIVDGTGAVVRMYGTGGGAADLVYFTSRVRGAPCLAYWRTEPGPTGPLDARRWYCTD